VPVAGTVSGAAPNITSRPPPSTRARPIRSCRHAVQWTDPGRGTDGDDFQGSTNYPIVRITNSADGPCLLCPHLQSQHVESSRQARRAFDELSPFPDNAEIGPSTLVVIANGIHPLPRTVVAFSTAATPLRPVFSPAMAAVSIPTLLWRQRQRAGGNLADETARRFLRRTVWGW